MTSVRFLVATALASALMLTAVEARAQATDTAVKAAFLPRFARYVTWPPTAAPTGGAPYVLCVLGSDPFGGALDAAARSQSVDGRRIQVRRLGGSTKVDGCHIVYVQGGRSNTTGQMLAAISNKPVLTVTDAANGGQRGIIHFSVASGRVRFFIDEVDAKQRGLNISSRLLALAVGVRQR
jgi:hypothetical protein